MTQGHRGMGHQVRKWKTGERGTLRPRPLLRWWGSKAREGKQFRTGYFDSCLPALGVAP